MAGTLVAVACVQAVPSPRPRPEGAKLLPYLFVLRDVYATAAEVELQNRLFTPAGKVVFEAADSPPAGTESTLRIVDEEGREVHRAANAFLAVMPLSKFPEWKGKAHFMLSPTHVLPALAPGHYRAVWTVGGTPSNPAAFEIRPAHELADTPLVRVDAVPDTHGLEDFEKHFVVRITANGGSAMDVTRCYAAPVEVDGKRADRSAIVWGGPTSIGAGWSWMYTFGLDEFTDLDGTKFPLSSGPHRLRVQCHEQWSNELVF